MNVKYIYSYFYEAWLGEKDQCSSKSKGFQSLFSISASLLPCKLDTAGKKTVQDELRE